MMAAFISSLILASAISSASAQRIVFTNLAGDSEVARSGARQILQDDSGYIWMLGSDDVLIRFDGADTSSLCQDGLDGTGKAIRFSTIAMGKNGIWCAHKEGGLSLLDTKFLTIKGENLDTIRGQKLSFLKECENGDIWMASGLSVWLYETKTGALQNIGWKRKNGELTKGSRDELTSLHEDSQGNIRVGSQQGRLYSFNREHFFLEEIWSSSAPITSLHLDSAGRVWVATAGEGLFQLTAEFATQESFVPSSDNRHSIPSRYVTTLAEDSSGGLWVGTDKGLANYFPSTRSFYVYRGDADDARSLPSDRIQSIHEDNKRVLWIGSTAGVSHFPLGQVFFERIKHLAGEPESLTHDSVHAIFSDAQGRLLIGTDLGLDISDSVFSGFRHHALRQNEAPDHIDRITAITQDKNGDIWMGTESEGLIRYESATKGSYTYKFDAAAKLGLPDNRIVDIEMDHTGALWVALGGIGVVRFDENTQSFTPPHTADGSLLPLCMESFSDILSGYDGKLYLASRAGAIHTLIPQKGTAIPAETQETLDVEAEIAVIRQTTNFDLWIGTRGSGLFHQNASGGSVENYHTENSLIPDNDVVSIEIDNAKNLWIGTANGLAVINTKALTFRSFNRENGLQSMVFHPRSSFRDQRGRLYFGGPRGMNTIDPGRIPAEHDAPTVTISNLLFNGQIVRPSPENDFLQLPLSETHKIDLPFDKGRRISFQFATLDFQSGNPPTYRYRMLPLEKEWNVTRHLREAAYAPLKPGEYTLEAQASADGRQWNGKIASLKLNVTPPWYQMLWAKTLFFSVGVLIIAIALKILVLSRLSRAKHASEHAELEQKRAEAALAVQLNRSMLLQRMSEQMQTGNASQPFTPILGRLGSHLNARLCSIHVFSDRPTPVIRLLAEHLSADTPEHLSLAGLQITHPLVRNILRGPKAVISQTPSVNMLAIRTMHGGQSNGFITLFRAANMPWAEEEVHFIETLSTQLGVAIANHLLILDDKHNSRELAEARKTAELANHAKSEFLATMTHELRTPLNAILGFSQLLERDSNFTADQKNTLDIINSSGEHLLDIINDILEMSKIESGSCELCEEDFDLQRMLESIEQMLGMKAKAKSIAFDFKITPNVPRTVQADKGKLRQILVNLIGNALKFTEKGGITLAVDLAPKSAKSRSRLIFTVSDTGTGVAEAELHHLFQKFSQTESGRRSRQGTGLGLPIAKSFIELMGGTISVKSILGKGTDFTFDVRCDIVADMATDSAPGKKKNGYVTGIEGADKKPTILIAEDQPANRLLLSTLLKKVGFNVLEAENGRAAVQKWEEHRPDLIFMDQEMPIMNGNEATREILHRAAAHENPTIVSLTAHALEDSRKAALDAGCCDFLSKPFKHDDLFDLIAKHLPVIYQHA